MNVPAPGVALLARVMDRVAEPEAMADFAGSTFQVPSELSARAAEGTAAATKSAVRAETTVRRAEIVEAKRVMGSSIGLRGPRWAPSLASFRFTVLNGRHADGPP